MADKSLNLQIHEFSEGLVQYINSSPIPAECKRLILKDTLDALSQANSIQIRNEKLILEKEAKDTQNKE